MKTPNGVDKPKPEVKQELERIKSFAHSSLNQEDVLTWLIVKSLANGPKNWSELEKEVSIGTSTLSRKLKKMQKRKYLKRKIVPAFPPRTVYELNKERFPNLVETLVFFTKKLEITEEMVTTNLVINLNTQKIKFNKQLLEKLGETVKDSGPSVFNTAEEALHYLLTDLDYEIVSLISLMLSFPNTSSSLWSTFVAMILMQKIVAITNNLSVTSEMKNDAMLVLDRECKEKKKALQSLVHEKRLTKILGQTQAHATAIENNKEIESFFSK